MGDDITIGVTEIVNNIEVTAQPNDQIVDISVVDNTDEVTLNITPTVIEINVNKGSSYAKWGGIVGTLSDQEDLQDALDLKADLVDGKVPSSQLPSYVDDVIEVANYAALPAVGESGKIYLTLDNNHIYRWTGSTYVEITDNTAVWGAITGTLSSQTDLSTALNLKANDNAVVHLTGAETITGTKSFNSTTGIGIRNNVSGSGYGIYSDNSSTGIGFYVANSGQGKGFSIANVLGSFGNFYEGSYNGTLNYAVNYLGEITASKFVKQGGTSSQFLKADGSVDSTTYQAALTNPITGTGTTNYIPKFTGSTALGNSLLYDNGTNIGVGTISPNYKFTVIGANPTTAGIVSNRFIGLRKEDNTLLGYLGLLGGDNGDNAKIIGYNSSGTQTFEINASTSATYFNGGNVGIGTTSPSVKLHVIGKGIFDIGGSSGDVLVVDKTSGGNIAFNINGVYSGQIGAVGSGDLYIASKSTYPAIVVKDGGNVGIGTTAPNRALTIVGGNNEQIAITSTTTKCGIALNPSNTTYSPYIGATANNVIVETSGSERMRITSGGNVGIGTTSPATKLHIEGTGLGAWLTINRTDSGTNLVDFTQNGTRLGYLGYVGNDFYLQNATNSNTLFNTNNTERMRITSGGNVLVGTTSDVGSAKLQVYGNINSRNSNSANETYTRFYTATSNTVLTTSSTGAGNVIVVVVEYIGDYDYSGTYQTSGIIMASTRQSNGGTWSAINNTNVSKTISGGIDCAPTLSWSNGTLTLGIGGSVELVAKISVTYHNMNVTIN